MTHKLLDENYRHHRSMLSVFLKRTCARIIAEPDDKSARVVEDSPVELAIPWHEAWRSTKRIWSSEEGGVCLKLAIFLDVLVESGKSTVVDHLH